MKIVINKCYGGFGLSEAAIDYLIKKKGYARDKAEKLADSWNIADRANPDVIEAVEMLGIIEAGDVGSELKIIEITDEDITLDKLEISDYDGIETIREKARVWG